MANKLFEIKPCPRCGTTRLDISLSNWEADDGRWMCELRCGSCSFYVWATEGSTDKALEQAKLIWTKESVFGDCLDEMYSATNRLIESAEDARAFVYDWSDLPDGTIQKLTYIAEQAKGLREVIQSLQERNQEHEKD